MLKMFPNISTMLEQIPILRSVIAELTTFFKAYFTRIVKCAGN